jgi:hypothetical protein
MRSPLRLAIKVLWCVVIFDIISMFIAMQTSTDIDGLTIMTFVIAGLFIILFSRIAAAEEEID